MYAVFLDYELDGRRNTVILGGSVGSHIGAEVFLDHMSGGDSENGSWYVDEDTLPYGYKYQTYYVSSYTPDQQMLGVA